MNKTIGERLSPILEEIEMTLIEFEANINSQPKFTDKALRSATKIFMAVVLDEMFELQFNEGMAIEDRCNMAQKCGEEIRKIIKTYTGKDTFDFYQKKG